MECLCFVQSADCSSVCRCFETFDAITVMSKEDRLGLMKVMESCKTPQEKGVCGEEEEGWSIISGDTRAEHC